MIDKIINPYPNNHLGLDIDTETLSALELASKTAEKANEAIELVNQNEANVKDKVAKGDMLQKYKMSDGANFTGTWFGLKPKQVDISIPPLIDKLEQGIGKVVKSTDEITSAIAEGFKTLVIATVIDVNSNYTVPEDITLVFVNSGELHIKPNVTLTINCTIEADFKQIFSFENETAVITTYQVTDIWGDRPKIKNRIKIDWFGAKGNAVYNKNDFTISGNDDTPAFKRAMEFVQKASMKQVAGYLIQTPIIVEARAYATYYVQGDNILGLQDATKNMYFEFYGNGCSFFHRCGNNQSFIDNFGKLYKSKFHDFSVLPINQDPGFRGSFISSKEQVTCSNNEGTFENVTIGQLNYRTGYDIIFNITSLNMLDNFHHKNCFYMNCNKIYYNSNVEAMGWLFEKCFLATDNDDSIFFHNNCNLGGGFEIRNCEVLFTENNCTFLKLEGQVTDELFKIDCRVETHTNSMTMIDIDGGTVDTKGVNMINGSGGYSPANIISAKVTGTGFARFTDCALSQNFIVECKANHAMYYERALEFNNCIVWQAIGANNPYPIFKFKNPSDDLISHHDLLMSEFSSRKITINDRRLSGAWGMAELPISYGGKHREKYEFILSEKPLKVSCPMTLTPLPNYINITSLKIQLFDKNLTNVNGIKITVGSTGSGALDYSTTVDLSTYVNKSEILTNKFLSIPFNKFIKVEYLKDGNVVTTANLLPSSLLHIEYTAMDGQGQYQGYDFVHEIALV